MVDYKEGFIICPNHIKTKILSELVTDSSFKNYTFLSLEELKRKLTFDIKPEGYIFLANELNVKFSVSSSYISSLLSLNGSYNSKSGKFLLDIKELLEKKNYLIYDDIFNQRKKDMHFTFIGYEDTKELQYVISQLEDNTFDIFYPTALLNHKQLNYHAFLNIEDELAYVFDNIQTLLKNGIDISNIKLCNVSNEYIFLIKKYANLLSIPVVIPQENEVMSTKVYQEFIYKIEEGLSYEEIVNLLQSKDNYILNKLIDIINKYKLYLDNPINDLKYWPDLIKTISYENDLYDNYLEFITIDDLISYTDSYIYLLDFNINVPLIIKDERFIKDEEAKLLNLDETVTLNLINKTKVINSLQECNNLVISYSSMHSFKSSNISSLTTDLNMKEIKHNKNEYNMGLNQTLDNLHLSIMLDNYIKYNEQNDDLINYYHSDLKYNTYDNTFKPLDLTYFKDTIKNPFVLSYSDLHDFYQCPFKYYCKKILKIDTFTPTIDTMLGSYAHGVLQDFETLGESFDFEESSDKYLNQEKELAISKDYNFTNKDAFYFNKMKEHLNIVIDQIKSHKQNSSLNNSLCEKKMDVILDNGNLIFKGFIDKLWYDNDKKYLAIIDYKTGSDIESLNNLEYGLNLQLPVYIYLVKNDEEFKDANIVGFYLQKINIILPKSGEGTVLEQINKNLNIEGFTNPNLVNSIDTTRGSYLKNYKETKDGTPSAFSKVFTDEDIDTLFNIVSNKIDEAYDLIMNARFDITAKRIDKKNISCDFCPFKDVCFKTSKDIIELKGKKWKEEEDNANE